MICNIIGAGRIGQNIAYHLSAHQIIHLDSILNQSLTSGNKAAEHLGLGKAKAHIKDLTAADITWITCNDDAIESVVHKLNQQVTLKAGSYIIHCSGVLSSEVLHPLKAQGCFVGSIHPLKSFKSLYRDEPVFKGITCVLEGDSEVCEWLFAAFSRLEANLITVQASAKKIYHAAATTASNYLVTLAASSKALLLEAGLTAEQAHQMITNLMQGTLDNVKNCPNIAEALTGPLMRGDRNTLALHLNAIQNPEIQKLYKAAGLATLGLTQLPLEKAIKIREVLAV